MAASFHRFPELPWEIRSRIWEHTVEPRTVEARFTYDKKPITDEMMAKYDLERPSDFPFVVVRRLRSSTPVPAPLHVCRESRHHLILARKDGGGSRLGSGSGYYQKALHYGPHAYLRGGRTPKSLSQPDLQLELGMDLVPRYIWFNFEMDMFSIGRTCFDDLLSVKTKIKRLKFERAHDQKFTRFESLGLRIWVSLQEVHIVCADGLDNWALVEDDFDRRTSDILLIDGKTGETARPSDLILAAKWDLDELRVLQYRKNGYRINPYTRVPFVPWLPPGWLEGREYQGKIGYYDGEEDWQEWDDYDDDFFL